jgi:hypothetical protein
MRERRSRISSGLQGFYCTSKFKVITPVRLPPGRFRLLTMPERTGSFAALNTIL